MILYIYIGSIIFSVISYLVTLISSVIEMKSTFTHEERARLKNWNVKSKYSPLGKILIFICPIYNIILGLYFAFCYRELVDKMLIDAQKFLHNEN